VLGGGFIQSAAKRAAASTAARPLVEAMRG
jgi:hypothetical protein